MLVRCPCPFLDISGPDRKTCAFAFSQFDKSYGLHPCQDCSNSAAPCSHHSACWSHAPSPPSLVNPLEAETRSKPGDLPSSYHFIDSYSFPKTRPNLNRYVPDCKPYSLTKSEPHNSCCGDFVFVPRRDRSNSVCLCVFAGCFWTV